MRILDRGEEIRSIVIVFTKGAVEGFPLGDGQRGRSWVCIIEQWNSLFKPGLRLGWRENRLGLSFELVEEVISVRIHIAA
jgi:hypothetical protein